MRPPLPLPLWTRLGHLRQTTKAAHLRCYPSGNSISFCIPAWQNMIVLAPHLLPGRICQQDVNRRLMRKLGRNKNDFSQHCHTQGSLIKMLLAGEIKWWDILTSGFSFSVPNSLKNILNHLWNFRFSLYHLCELQHSELYIFLYEGVARERRLHSMPCTLLSACCGQSADTFNSRGHAKP